MQQKVADTIRVELILKVYGGYIPSSRQLIVLGALGWCNPLHSALSGRVVDLSEAARIIGAPEGFEATFVTFFRPNGQRVAVRVGARSVRGPSWKSPSELGRSAE